MDNKEKDIFRESVLSDGKKESRLTFYNDGNIHLSVKNIIVDSEED